MTKPGGVTSVHSDSIDLGAGAPLLPPSLGIPNPVRPRPDTPFAPLPWTPSHISEVVRLVNATPEDRRGRSTAVRRGHEESEGCCSGSYGMKAGIRGNSPAGPCPRWAGPFI